MTEISQCETKNFPIDLIQTKYNTLFIFYRDETLRKKCDMIEYSNHFFVKEEDVCRVINLVRELPRSPYHSYDVPRTMSNFKSIYGENLIRVIPNKYEFWKVKKALWEKEIQTYEYSLDVYLKYLLSHPEKKFSKNRRVGILDIENDMCLDVENPTAPITAITIYSYVHQAFYTWVLENPNRDKIFPRENLFIFDDESNLLKHFMDKVREFDFDIMGGWNSVNFDFPYLINRINKLGLDANNLSNFSHLEEEAVYVRTYMLHTKKGMRKNSNVFIMGMDVIDFIPILAKNMCYKPVPSSWSLKSTAAFYLGEEHQKLVQIGAGSWRTDINKFIIYNIQDVEIVRELVDRFRLIDFLTMIQTEIVPVPLGNVTHNSIVLLYYLKFLFPNHKLPDNLGFKYMDSERINLKEFRLKMKAAHVINATPGIHENVAIFDVSGMYPSIFRTFNISPETMSEDGVEIDDITIWKLNNDVDEKDENGKIDDDIDKSVILKEWIFKKKYSQGEVGLYPMLLKNLVDKRKTHKENAKKFKELYGDQDPRYLSEESKNDVIKQINNSIYGVNGFWKTILFNPIIGASITAMSRKIIRWAESHINNKLNHKVLSGDTDSIFIKAPSGINWKELENEVNEELKKYLLENYLGLDKSRYCISFEHAKTFKRFVMKDAKKKYYGILEDGKFYAKGFSLIQHVMDKEIKKIIEEIYIKLMNNENSEVLRERLKELKNIFFSFDYTHLTQELKLANNPDSYDTNVRHVRAALYSNKYLNTNFKAGDSGKLLMIKDVIITGKYPKTDVIFLDENTKLPQEFIIDYEKCWQKLVLDNISLLESIDEMQIKHLLSPNKSLFEFGK